ncbi:TIGR03118 family protein [Rhodanobacter ginsengisoli]|uniref:TIGR03118 family protein n=1 Tax=Rhodanobacter ginsengisoli TaxID=418646 RepID=A0ABW0QKI1_9GAMM
MKLFSSTSSRLCAALALVFTIVAAPAASAGGATYKRHNLVSDGFVPADHVDPHLVNTWGIAFNPSGAVWVANNGSGTSTLYDGDGNVLSLVVQIPGPTTDGGGNPTGVVYNGSGDFVVSKGAVSGPSRFIFATEDGVIAAWAPNVDATHAVRVRTAGSAIYKGLAISAGGNGGQIYATDFFNAKVDVYDSHFALVALPPGAFRDPGIPHGFAPFGIQNIHGDIYVTYAKQDAGRHDDVQGPGLGFVDAYTPNGRLLRRIASRGALNAPWGMAMAPAGFGLFGNTLLVGNFGDGRINAYDPIFNIPLGSLRDASYRPVRIEGLWGIAFGNGYLHQSVDSLYFTAGPADEEHGVYGRLDAQ